MVVVVVVVVVVVEDGEDDEGGGVGVEASLGSRGETSCLCMDGGGAEEGSIMRGIKGLLGMRGGAE